MDFKIPLLLVTLSYACLIFMTADALPLGEALDKEIAEELGLFKPVPDRRERLLASLSNPSKSMDYGFGMDFGKRSSPFSRRGKAAWRSARQRLLDLAAED